MCKRACDANTKCCFVCSIRYWALKDSFPTREMRRLRCDSKISTARWTSSKRKFPTQTLSWREMAVEVRHDVAQNNAFSQMTFMGALDIGDVFF